MDSPSVSVVIPCFNGAAYLAQTIESIVSQTYQPAQILVVDDGSADDSPLIAARYPVELVAHEKNLGLAQARNSGWRRSQGDVVAYVDVDAQAAPDMLALLVSGYVDDSVGGVGGQGVEANVHSLADRWRRAHASQSLGGSPLWAEHLYGLCMSYRRAVLAQVGGFNPMFRTNAEDVDVGLRIRAAGYRLRYLPGARVYHQRSDTVDSLKRTMANWYEAGYRAKRANQSRPWTLFVGSARRLVTDPWQDLWGERDVRLALLSWQISWIKLRALFRAWSQPISLHS